eukprot:CAMPEP_0177650068 /NCGR_PEP_ID=MMETSP0447-20121125/11732_1 /TAXON_ID=0 /ORGANISM="Stygamoeba regulata, Strain BSH-02190019" /LENGTH=504 /DNA_ID=CAMNT_0019152887 /DNA_START=53 /DNA_END=1567 /DNA_ORIENTATION=+
MAFRNRSFVEIESFSREELEYILRVARDFKAALQNKEIEKYRLADKLDLICASLFYENSTRTNTSFAIAASRLGLKVQGFSGTEGTSVKKGESLRHTLDMYEAYQCDAVVLRHPLDGSAKFASDHLQVPVFNGGDGKNQHPTQTILDLFTIQEHTGRLDDLDIGICGDLKYGRTSHSLVVALTKFRSVRVHLFSHPDLALPTALLSFLKENCEKVVVHDTLVGLAPHVDVLYCTRIQKERMPDLSEFERAKEVSTFTLDMLATTRAGFGIMHPLPMDKAAPSIVPEIDTHPAALYKRQAGNGVPTRLTELALSLGLAGQDYLTPRSDSIAKEESFIKHLTVLEKPLRTDVSIRPIRQNGVVIDHIIPYQEEILARVLRVRERHDIYRSGTVRSVARPEHTKGMLMIEDRTFTHEELKAIAVISPGCRVNTIRNGKVVEKIDLTLPCIIDVDLNHHIVKCLNTNCITRPEHLENVATKFLRISPECVKCYYCNNICPSSSIFHSK